MRGWRQGLLQTPCTHFHSRKSRQVNISLEVVSYRNSMLFALKMKSLFQKQYDKYFHFNMVFFLLEITFI